jgi:HSP90 family molecular chaperone
MSGDEHEIDFQVGSHETDSNPVDFEGETEHIEYDLEVQTVFKRLADDIYKSDEAGIREPVTNSITAIIDAVEEGFIEEERGVLEITLQAGELIIKDNGIGISEEKLRKVLAVIGRSTSRDSDARPGKFGMGFLALYKLSELDGGFIMHSRSRRTDDYISGVWKNGGFTWCKEDGGFPYKQMDDDEYGTKLVIPLKKSLDSDDIREWVKRNTEYARHNVIYREFNEDGDEVFNEDYGDKKLDPASKKLCMKTNISRLSRGTTTSMTRKHYYLMCQLECEGELAITYMGRMLLVSG